MKQIKNFFHNFKPSIIKKRIRLFKKTFKYHKNAIHQLKKKGFKKIKKYSLNTWKYYGINHVRMTYIANYIGGERYIIKVTRGFDVKSSNSIKFQELFNNRFDFIPKGFSLKLDNFICQVHKFIDSFCFDELKQKEKINENNIVNFLKQSIHILDELSKEEIVHCDLVGVNLIIEKKTNKLFLIDWDTVCSKKYNLVSDAFPPQTTKRSINGKFVYDDAYSFQVLFGGLKINKSIMNPYYDKILSMVNRNVWIDNK